MGIILFALFALLTAVAIFYAIGPIFDERSHDRRIRGSGFLLALIFGVLAILATGIKQIDAGFVGVVKQLGAVTGQVLQPGITWITPFVTSVDDVDTRVRQVRIENYTAASREQQDLFLNITLNYHVDPTKAPSIIQNIGQDFEAKIVLPRFLDIPKSVTDDYPTTIVLNSRDEIRTKATDLLRDSLVPFGFVVDNVVIENFSYSAEYNQSIEQKQIAQQQVETEKQKVIQQEQIALQREAEAKGLANAQIERARGEAEANRLVAASLTENILINRYIEKLAPGIKSILVPSENGFILDLGSLLTEPQPTAAP